MKSETIEEVARIARLKLTETERTEFSKDLEEVLEYFSMLDEAPGEKEYGLNPIEILDMLREDEVRREIDPELLIRMMDTFEELVRGPRLV
ncbi:MAG: Asp-tRNA(Asn)/Glu-tRNA(Gln) amidotransferase GatCAB subunit C [Methanomassiliicoccales archaeon]|nr:Asp-tRNA(Asn)/Glu-tRNA(Gln) amidotransferase GatCAB subunit C [Methanomassiliicoccales archaeon]